MAITKDQIMAAADAIADGGDTPTLAAIRDRIGGSYTTIAPVLREWKANQHTDDTPISDPVPESISGRISGLGAEVWAEALTLANNRLAAEREALETQRAEIEGEQAEAVELADNLASEIDSLKDREAEARSETRRLQNELDQMASDFRNHQLESQATIGKLESARDKANEALAMERERREEMRGDLLNEREQREQQDERWRAELAAKEHEASEAIDKLRSQLSDAHNGQAKAEKALAEAQTKTQQYQEQKKASAKEAVTQAERFTSVQAERDAAAKDARDAREEAATLRGKIEGLETALAQSRASSKTV